MNTTPPVPENQTDPEIQEWQTLDGEDFYMTLVMKQPEKQKREASSVHFPLTLRLATAWR